MLRVKNAVRGFIALSVVIAATPTYSQIRDAVYRGTIVCDKLPFTERKMREAISVRIAGGTVRYSHVVRLRDVPEAVAEEGTGKLEGTALSLQGTWSSGDRQYQASYSGNFVRRSARLKGTQIWTDGGKTINRSCSGVIKRPLRAFLPRERKTP